MSYEIREKLVPYTNAVMVMNESGKLRDLPLNNNASLLMGFFVVGDVLVCLRKMIR